MRGVIDELLWARLIQCRTVRLTVQSGVPLSRSRHIRLRVIGRRFESVSYVQKQGESFNDLARRVLNELDRREKHGMPRPSPKVKEQRRRRALLQSANTRPM